MIMAANEHPLERNKPPIFVIVADNRNGRFRVPPMLEVYLELKGATDHGLTLG